MPTPYERIGNPPADGWALVSTKEGARYWAPPGSMLDAVFSNPESVLDGEPLPTVVVDPVFTNPESRLP